MKTKIKPPKMTELQKAQQKAGSRFCRLISSENYAAYLKSPQSRHEYDDKGRRVK